MYALTDLFNDECSNKGEIVKEIRATMGLSQKEMASKFGATRSVISSVENDRGVIPPSRALMMANLLFEHYSRAGIKKKKLIEEKFGKNLMIDSVQEKFREYLDLNEKSLRTQSLEPMIKQDTLKSSEPRIKMLEVIADELLPKGLDNLKNSLDFEGMMKITGKDCDFAIRVKDDSMDPIMKENDIILVKRSKELEDGDIGVFIIDYSTQILAEYSKIDDWVLLKRANPIYEDIAIKEGSTTYLEIVGKVV